VVGVFANHFFGLKLIGADTDQMQEECAHRCRPALNDRALPFFEENGIPLLRMLTDRGTEYCGRPEYHEYQLYLTVEGIEHSKTKTRLPQSNGICEHFHRTIQDEFYAGAFRKKLYQSLEQMQQDLDEWMEHYNNERTHSGKYCFGKTPAQTFAESKH